MVDALRAAREALRPRGRLVDIQPERHYQPRLSVVDARGRVDLGAIVREPDEAVMAGHAARERAIRLGLFREVLRADRTYRARFRTLSAFDAELVSNTNWRLPRGSRARLERAWRPRRGEAAIVLAKRFTVTVLQKA